MIVVQESHWAVGWVERIAIHESDAATADWPKAKLADYPVLDEMDWSERDSTRKAMLGSRARLVNVCGIARKRASHCHGAP